MKEEIKKIFEEQHEKLKIRTPQEQTIIGNLLTVLEGEIIKVVKNIK